tara:strand:+ start:198 stop:641 length:444 start_codon:yes stop_codon:yes gene_type:complete
MNEVDNLKWDYKHPHYLTFKVSESQIDILGHVNNKVYLDWCELVSWDHSRSLGVTPEIYKKLKCACVVVNNNIDYVGSLFKDDQIAISTWITQTDSKIKLSRLFQIIRINDNKVIFRSNVNYVCISLESFKPKKMPQLFRDSYKVTI